MLTADDLRLIRGVMDESIAEHPRFEQLKIEILDEVEVRVGAAIADMSEVMQEGFTLVGERFDLVDKRFDAMDKRFDTVETRLGGVNTVWDI